jgi:hypothetical protein
VDTPQPSQSVKKAPPKYKSPLASNQIASNQIVSYISPPDFLLGDILKPSDRNLCQTNALF